MFQLTTHASVLKARAPLMNQHPVHSSRVAVLSGARSRLSPAHFPALRNQKIPHAAILRMRTSAACAPRARDRRQRRCRSPSAMRHARSPNSRTSGSPETTVRASQKRRDRHVAISIGSQPPDGVGDSHTRLCQPVSSSLSGTHHKGSSPSNHNTRSSPATLNSRHTPLNRRTRLSHRPPLSHPILRSSPATPSALAAPAALRSRRCRVVEAFATLSAGSG